MDLRILKKNYPVTSQGVFLNHAATSPISLGSIARMKEINDKMSEPLSKHFYQWLGIVETTRRKIAELIGAHPSEIAFTQNTSTALSIIANAVPFRSGDRVLVPSDEFPSNIYAWQNLADQGVECTLFDPVPDEPLIVTLGKLNLDRVKLISISAVSYKTGRLYELEDFARFCRERNILSCLDAIQAIGVVPLNIRTIGADFLASGAQKWLLGPIGCGFFYARRDLLTSLHVPFVGWTSVKYPERFESNLDFANEMTRFEPGLPNILPIVGLENSLNELHQISFAAIYEGIKKSSDYLRSAIKDLRLPLLLGEKDLPSGIVSCKIPTDMDKIAFAEHLEKHQCIVTLREDYLRLSPHFYTEKKDMDVVLNLLSDAIKRPWKSTLIEKKVDKQPSDVQKKQSWAILTGATGVLGTKIAYQLRSRGYHLLLLAQTSDNLQKLKEGLQQDLHQDLQIKTYTIDYRNPQEIDTFIEFAKNNNCDYSMLINSAGIAFAEPFSDLTENQLNELFQINVFSSAKLTQGFINQLRSAQTKGVLNILPVPARCGFPLLSAYGASMGAWWTMGEALDREMRKEGIWVTSFVAPAMHSKIQKQLGRVALRYFKMSGIFDYAHADHVAKDALEAFFAKKSVVIAFSDRIKLLLNLWWPSFLTRKMIKNWRR